MAVGMEDGRGGKRGMFRQVEKPAGVKIGKRSVTHLLDGAIVPLNFFSIGQVQRKPRRQRVEPEAVHHPFLEHRAAVLPRLQRGDFDGSLLEHPRI